MLEYNSAFVGVRSHSYETLQGKKCKAGVVSEMLLVEHSTICAQQLYNNIHVYMQYVRVS